MIGNDHNTKSQAPLPGLRATTISAKVLKS